MSELMNALNYKSVCTIWRKLENIGQRKMLIHQLERYKIQDTRYNMQIQEVTDVQPQHSFQVKGQHQRLPNEPKFRLSFHQRFAHEKKGKFKIFIRESSLIMPYQYSIRVPLFKESCVLKSYKVMQLFSDSSQSHQVQITLHPYRLVEV